MGKGRLEKRGEWGKGEGGRKKEAGGNGERQEVRVRQREGTRTRIGGQGGKE